MTIRRDAPAGVERDPRDVANRPEMTRAELALIARFDRHGDDADVLVARRRDQHGGLENEIVGFDVGELERGGRVVALAALRIGDRNAATPRDAPVREIVRATARLRLIFAI